MKYTQDQVSAYLSRISFATRKCKAITPETVRSADGLNYLSNLQICHLVSIPFESLSLHYSQDRFVSIDEEIISEKMVGCGKGRGGYCMEQILLFGNILRSLGFEVVSTGARVMGDDGYKGWDHQVSLVSSGPTRPIKLENGKTVKWGATEAESRLIYQDTPHPPFQGLWIMQHRNSPSDKWSPKYCFGTTEFTAEDFDVMNYATSTKRSGVFTYSVVGSKLILDEDVGDIVGAVNLSGDTIKRRMRENSEVLVECKTERERVAALKEHFEIVLTRKEQAGIRGTVTELKG